MKKEYSIILFMLLVTFTSAQQQELKETIKNVHIFGYMVTEREPEDQSFNAGYSMYSNAYPLLKNYPGRAFQSGLFGTWMFPFYTDEENIGHHDLYTDIEGGLGWWRDTEYATETPKFIMGGVQLDFIGWANGPGAGRGRDWDNPKGKYGVAQLSPWILWPPDGLNLKQGTCNEFFGSGYLPLPLTEPKSVTAGKNVSTGNQCWTLFLNTVNFKGPVTFFTPFFWSEITAEKPELEGKFLDQRPTEANKSFQMETQFIHASEGTDSKGQRYAKIAPTQYPVNDDGNSELLHRLMVYNKKALWDDVEEWFRGGEPADSKINIKEGSSMQRFKKRISSSWGLYPRHLAIVDDEAEVEEDEEEVTDEYLNITDFMNTDVTEHSTLRIRWEGDLFKVRKISNGRSVITFPEYYKFREKDTTWVAVAPEDVPLETGLHDINFKRAYEGPNKTYVTPEDKGSVWKTPGPVSGPLKAKLGDGSTVTYYWYKFADQPALLKADMSKEEREEMQRRVELLHKHWTKEREYLPPPMIGKLAEIDPALIVSPPKGLEVGYVPIVTRQGVE